MIAFADDLLSCVECQKIIATGLMSKFNASGIALFEK